MDPASTTAHHNVATVATVEPTPQIAHLAAAVTRLPYIPHPLLRSAYGSNRYRL